MIDDRTTSSPEPPNDRDDDKTVPSKDQFATAESPMRPQEKGENNRFTNLYNLKISTTKENSAIKSSIAYRRIFDAIKKIDNTAIITSLDQVCIKKIRTFYQDEYKRKHSKTVART